MYLSLGNVLKQQRLKTADEKDPRGNPHVNDTLNHYCISEGRIPKAHSSIAETIRNYFFQSGGRSIGEADASVAVHTAGRDSSSTHCGCCNIETMDLLETTGNNAGVVLNYFISYCLVDETVGELSKDEHRSGEGRPVDHGTYHSDEQEDPVKECGETKLPVV